MAWHDTRYSFLTAAALSSRHSLLISNCLVLFEQIFRIKKFLSPKCICVNHTHLEVDHSAFYLSHNPSKGPQIGSLIDLFFPHLFGIWYMNWFWGYLITLQH